MNLPDELKHD